MSQQNQQNQQLSLSVHADALAREVLSDIAGHDWNDPSNVLVLFAKLMQLDTRRPVHKQGRNPGINSVPGAIMTMSNEDPSKPFWVFQRVISKTTDNGSPYYTVPGAAFTSGQVSLVTKMDVITRSDLFRARMDAVASSIDCTWTYRVSKSASPNTHLYNKNMKRSWLEKCSEHLLVPGQTVNEVLEDLRMIEFRRKN